MIDLSGKKILVTGASSGIGAEVARLCAKLGAYVYATGRNGSALLEEMKGVGGVKLIPSIDLTKEDELNKLVTELPELNGVVHAAGIVMPMPIKFVQPKHLDKVFGINFRAVVLLNSFLLRSKKILNGSSLVFLSSISVNHPYLGGGLYVSSKAAIEAYSKTVALELSSKKVRSNTIAPALVKTKIFEETIKAASEKEIKKYEKQYPFGFGEPVDVANLAAFLLSESSRWITGETIKMDGGLTLSSK